MAAPGGMSPRKKFKISSRLFRKRVRSFLDTPLAGCQASPQFFLAGNLREPYDLGLPFVSDLNGRNVTHYLDNYRRFISSSTCARNDHSRR